MKLETFNNVASATLATIVGASVAGVIAYEVGFNDGDEQRKLCMHELSEISEVIERRDDTAYTSNERFLLTQEIDRMREAAMPVCNDIDLGWRGRDTLGL